MTESRRRKGISVLESIIAVLVFAIVFIPLYRLYTETGVEQQKMVRDFAVAINIAENALSLIESEIDKGSLPNPVTEQDVSSLFLGNPNTQKAIQGMLGYGAAESVKYIPAFRLFLTTRPYKGNANLYEIRLRFVWGSQKTGNSIEEKHEFELKTLRTCM
ncbi:MAG TPA: hypothetical protein PKO06_15520 [Candidatus Ozemobacteraceae bacterium]|nr:hypothetical protein [Candidatus Ozemobacteraceae bacterium]